MKADAPKLSAGLTGGTVGRRRPYATQACDVCRRKKIKCDEMKPVCGPCESSKRQGECSWSGENVRVPRTEAHFEALRKRVEALQTYADYLESMLDKCKREHGGVSDESDSYRQFRPQLETYTSDEYLSPEAGDGIDVGQELSVSTENLKLEDRDLVFYGAAAPFRFAEVPVIRNSRLPDIVDNPAARYVLLLDGVDESYYDPYLEWSRYLPSSVGLDRREHDKLLDLLFKFFTSWCLRVVPALFLRDMYRALSVPASQPPPKTPHYSPMLHNALIALAAAFSDDPRICDLATRQKFATVAKGYIDVECQKPNICVVQALSLLGSFHSSQGDENLGYMYFGMSTRIGQILGLNIDCSGWVKSGLISHDDMLDRNWAHWTSFSLDVCWSLYVGRDCTVAVPSDGQSIPVPFVDADFDQIPLQFESSDVPPQPTYLSRTFAATCELLVITRRLMEVVNTLNKSGTLPSINDEVISRIDLQLNTWKGNLSPEVDITLANRNTATPHRLMMHLLYWLAFILLHRPFYHRRTRAIYSTDKEIDHVKLCKRAAENIMDLLATWQRLYGLRYAPVTLFQAVFSAGTIYLLLAVQAASGPRVAKSSLMTSLSQVELCIRYLREVGRSWKSASNIAEILSKLLQEQLKPLLEKGTGNTNVYLSVPVAQTSPPLQQYEPYTDPHPEPPAVRPADQSAARNNLAVQVPSHTWGTLDSSGSSGLHSGAYSNTSSSSSLDAIGYLSGSISGSNSDQYPDMAYIPPAAVFNVDLFQHQLGSFEQDSLPAIPEAELAMLAEFWDQLYGYKASNSL